MGGKVLFSVIVTVYNKGRVLKETLESIANQTFDNFECIIIDDGSTDNSNIISQDFCKKYSKFQHFEYENAGVGKARNRGINQANGEYIVFVDGDDNVEKELLEILHKYINNYDIDLIRYQCKVVHYRAVKEPEKLNYHSHIDKLMTGYEALLKWSEPNKRYALAWLYCIKKTILTDNGIKFPKGIYEDFATMPLVIACARNVICTDYVGYNYMHRINETSLMNGDLDEGDRIEGFVKAYRYALRMLGNLDIPKETKYFLLEDYNSRLKAEFDYVRNNINLQEQGEKFKEVYKKIQTYIERNIDTIKINDIAEER